MPILKPATPGFLTTLAATILLAIVSFSVPYFHSVFFLKASLAVEGQSGDITFGTLGYCLVYNGNTTCSSPSIGYELDINKLVGNKLPIQIPEVAVKWITYALVLHIVALGLAAISALFGLLAHVREMSMTCFSSCISGFGATVALLAFIFDIAFFFIAKSRLNSVQGGSATFGNAIWLTLAAWVLLFFSGCFYGIGRCCIKRRPRNQWGSSKEPGGEGGNGYAEQMRLDAVKAEADRKARQKRGEVGLPAFQEYDPSQPLYAKVDGDTVHADDDDDSDRYRDNASQFRPHNQGAAQTTAYAGGYVQGTPGHRAIDEYNSPTTTQPPQPHRQGSQHTQATSPPQPHRQGSQHTQATSGYDGSYYGYGAGTAATTAAAAAAVPATSNQYLSTAPYQDPYGGQNYGHTQGGTSYNSATAHQQYPSAQYDPYGAPTQQQYNPYNAPTQQHYQEPSFNPETYNNTALLAAAGITSHRTPSPYESQPAPAQQPERSYTLGGGSYDTGYGVNQVPDHSHFNDNRYFPSPYQGTSSPPHPTSVSPAPINTGVSSMPGPSTTSPVRGARQMSSPTHQYSDNPPSYDTGTSQPPGAWGEKH